jgi:hypothetical protein
VTNIEQAGLHGELLLSHEPRLATIHDWPLSLCAGGYERGPSGTTLEVMAVRCSAIPDKLVSAANGIDDAYREIGEDTVPLVLLQHFGGNLDNWDQALVDAPTAAGP